MSNFPHEMTARSCRASRDSGWPKDSTCVTGLSQSAGIPSVPLSVPQAFDWAVTNGAEQIVPFPRASAAEAPITAPFVPPGAFLEGSPPQRRLHDCASCTISCVERGPRGRVVCNKASKKRAKAACRQPRRPIATPPLALRCAPDSGFYRSRVRRSARETFKGATSHSWDSDRPDGTPPK